MQSWRFLLHMANHLSFTVRISMNHRNSVLFHFVSWIFHTLQTLANQQHSNCSNYPINMIPSNILPFGLFFSQHGPFHTLWVRLHYTLTPQSKFLKQNKPIWKEPLCSGQLSITDTILRSRQCLLQGGFTVMLQYMAFRWNSGD